MRRRLLLLALCAAATLAACGSAPPPLKPLAKDAVIVALGDSLTYGSGGRGTTYPQQLAQLIGREVINAGIPGETSAGAKARTADLLARHRPQLLIVCTGGNDFLRRQPSAATAQNIGGIVETARAAGVQVVLIAVPRVFPLPLNHPIYGDIAGRYNLWLEDGIMKTVLFDTALKSDQIHANAAGYRKIAEAVAALLRRAGAV